jgi:YbbR domain-containing protein
MSGVYIYGNQSKQMSQNSSGDAKVEIYDTNGNPLFTESNPASVQLKRRTQQTIQTHNAVSVARERCFFKCVD